MYRSNAAKTELFEVTDMRQIYIYSTLSEKVIYLFSSATSTLVSDSGLHTSPISTVKLQKTPRFA